VGRQGPGLGPAAVRAHPPGAGRGARDLGALYTFVTDGVESAIRQAKAAAGDKHVSLAGSQAAQQCLRAGLLDELWLALVPLLLGGGVRLLDHIGGPVRLEKLSVVDAPDVTHLSYRVVGR
jgi:dihydrofolate reductase